MVVKHPVDSKTAQRFIDEDFHDRGMMKWQGFMLSDHTAYIEREQHHSTVVARPKQAQSIIKDMIDQSINEIRAVTIQLVNHSDLIEVSGTIRGVQSDQLFIKTKAGIESFALTAIKNIRFK
ncbi:hypothetical protein [Nicoliella lavandulae]|uniref:DNA-directed RNA polymerase beta subunit n=1 Tax=Nicoliella lavandulae TaxID=3082954 RepID=A0ABU8SLR7_9LACO